MIFDGVYFVVVSDECVKACFGRVANCDVPVSGHVLGMFLDPSIVETTNSPFNFRSVEKTAMLKWVV